MVDSWSAADGWPGPQAGIVDLIAFDLKDATAADWALLSVDERARADRLILEHKRQHFVMGRATLRRLLGTALGRAPEAIEFEYGEHGKPELPDTPGLRFNLTHSYELAILAVGEDERLGVDVEHARTGRAFEDIARTFFSPRERDDLLRLSASDRPPAFYRAWTRKEAYLKALGTGLSFASSRFTIRFGQDEEAALVATEYPGDDPTRWKMVDVVPGGPYAAAVCWDGPPRRLRRYRVAESGR
jgi:4'-phosphopantetheinyl transferase